MANRYVLVKSDGDGPKPCAFYASAAGCRNAASCKFLHGDQPTAGSLSAKSQPPSATKAEPAAAAVTTPMPTPAVSVTPPSANGHSAAAEEAERAAKKKAKKKAKKEREAREAAAAAAPATTPAPAPAPVANGYSAAAGEAEGTANKKAKKKAKKEREAREAAAAAPATTPAPAPAPAPVAPPAAPTPTPAGTPAPVAVAAGQTLSKTKAKKQAFREKVARKAEATAALATANANAANAAAAAASAAASAAAARAANPSPPSAPAPTPVAPAVVPGAAAPTPVAAAAAPALPVSKKKKRKNKKKAVPAATPPAVLAPIPASPAPAATPAPAGAVAGPPPPVFRQMPKMSTPPPPPATASKPTTRVCSFFNKKKGCQVGALCPYLHQGVERGGFGGTRGHAKPPTATVPPAAVVPPPASPVAVAAAAAPKSNKRKPASSPVAPAVYVAAVAAPAAAVMPVLPFAPPPPPTAVQAVPAPAEVAGGAASESPSSPRKRKRGRSETPAAAAAAAHAGIFDGLPISPFVAAAAAAADKEEEPAAVAAVVAPASIPHPKADVWQGLVERTRAHPKFAKNYRFDTDATWVTASPCGDSCPGLPQVIALDCEMCMSEDPLSKERNGKELLRLSIVRGEDGEKLMDTLVRPGNPVVDWRTDIHGVAREHLEGVMFTHRHAQVAISRICCPHTVIVGHALNNDLSALKMKHDRVVDTSFLFEGSDEKFSTPSLKDVVKVALGRHIQDGSHDSVTDAKSTLEVARYALEKVGAPLPPIDRTKKASRRRNGEGYSDDAGGRKKRRGLENGEDNADVRAAKAERERRSLMVHRLPAGTTPEQLMRVMQKKTKVIAQEAEGIEFTGTTGKTHVVYATKELADVAFNGISTAAKEDTSGRLQKKIYTSEDGKKYIAVRHALVMNDDEEEAATGLDGLISSSSSSEED